MADDETSQVEGEEAEEAAQGASDHAAPPPIRTPLYRASNAARYGRQTRIREIERQTGSRLICYVAGPLAPVHRDDVVSFVDLFHTIPQGESIDLLLHTSGGDIDAAEKMASMLRKRVGASSTLRVIVPDYAKSAGTLLAMTANTIIMSDSSELGPVDPQLYLPDGRGGRQYQPAQSYVDGYEELLKLVNAHSDAAGYQQMLDKYDPTWVDRCKKAIQRSVKLGETLLQGGMFRPDWNRTGGNFTAVASRLANNHEWLVHGAPIDYLEAKRLLLDITYWEPEHPIWQELWALYCEQRLALTSEDCKLFESNYVSLPLS